MLFVGVFCGSDLFTGVCVCAVLYIVFSYTPLSFMHNTYFLFNACESAGCICVTCCVWFVSKLLFTFPHPSPPAAIVLCSIIIGVYVVTVGDEMDKT